MTIVFCRAAVQVLAAGWKPPPHVVNGHHGEGECTLHARECGGGIGVFFLVQRCAPVRSATVADGTLMCF